MRRSLARVRHTRPLPRIESAAAPEGVDAPLVSIIVATFNRSNVLRFALDSIRDQSLADWEALVIGDCCTDDTRAVVESLADPRIRFLNLPRNTGDQSGPNSVGARIARGRYLAWLNHDDLWFPDHLETLVSELEGAQADFAVAPCLRVFDIAERSGSVVGLAHVPEVHWPLTMSRGDSFLTSCWLMRRELAARVGDWRRADTVRYASSQEYFYRAWSAGARIIPGSKRSVVVMPSIARPNAYPTRRDVEHTVVAGLVRAGDPGPLLAMRAEGSEVLVSPVMELPAPDRPRGAISRWILRHRVAVFRVTAPLAVRLGWPPWEYAGLLVGFPRGGLHTLLRAGRGLPAGR
jgi:glycosyltransferase involved in cell wall biosynthesis